MFGVAPTYAQKVAPTAPALAPFSVVTGTVETPGKDRQLPIPGVMVTVHRVGSDSSGALDSVRSDAHGQYSLRYRRVGADDAIYFAAAVYRGIAYFSAPLKSARATGEEGTITVFDTTTRPVEFHVQGHHVVVSTPHPDGVRDLVEVWELSNDTTLTVVGRDSASAVWTAPLPRGAANLAGGQGDVAADALVARGDHVALLAAFGPGVKQLSYSYTLPATSFPLKLSTERVASVYEVLLEEPTAQLHGDALKRMAAATTQGRMFQRFLGQDVAKGTTIEIVVPESAGAAGRGALIAIAVAIVLIMAAALGRALVGRSAGVRAVAVAPVRGAESMVAAIAILDARRERGDSTMDESQYASQRAALKTQLAAALVAEERAI